MHAVFYIFVIFIFRNLKNHLMSILFRLMNSIQIFRVLISFYWNAELRINRLEDKLFIFCLWTILDFDKLFWYLKLNLLGCLYILSLQMFTIFHLIIHNYFLTYELFFTLINYFDKKGVLLFLIIDFTLNVHLFFK